MTDYKSPKENEKFTAIDLLGTVLFIVFILCLTMLPAIWDEFL